MIIDLIVIVVLLASALLAFLRGLIREVLTIFGVLGGLVAAYFGGPAVRPIFRNFLGVREGEEPPAKFLDILPYPLLADILAYASIFLVVVIILSIVSHILSKIVEKIGLGMVDRTLGVFFGLVRGLLILALLYLPAHLFLKDEEKERWFGESRTIFYVEMTAQWLTGLLPNSFLEEEAREQANQTREKLRSLKILPEGEEKGEKGERGSEEDETQGYDEDQRQSIEQLIQKEN